MLREMAETKKREAIGLSFVYRYAGLIASGRQIDKDLGADQQAVIVQIVGVPMQVVAEPLLPLRLPLSPD